MNESQKEIFLNKTWTWIEQNVENLSLKNYGKMLRKRIYAEIDDFEKMDKVEALFEQPLPPLPTLEPRPKKARQGFS